MHAALKTLKFCLHKESEDETAVAILDLLKAVITRDTVNPSDTEISLVSFLGESMRLQS